MIKQAIIPLAGLGTRLLPLTSVFAKELLPINGRPGIEYILDECIDAGIKEVVFIISDKKIMIKDYFYNDAFYKSIIKKKKDPRITKEYKKIFMGEKDYQQLHLVKEYIEKNYESKIIPCKTIRDNNNLALSSRNILLNKTELVKAGKLATNIINFVKRSITSITPSKCPFLNFAHKTLSFLFNLILDFRLKP